MSRDQIGLGSYLKIRLHSPGTSPDWSNSLRRLSQPSQESNLTRVATLTQPKQARATTQAKQSRHVSLPNFSRKFPPSLPDFPKWGLQLPRVKLKSRQDLSKSNDQSRKSSFFLYLLYGNHSVKLNRGQFPRCSDRNRQFIDIWTNYSQSAASRPSALSVS